MINLRRSICPFLFPSIIWHTTSSSIHLTFDDGPHPDSTPEILRILERHHVNATFFLLGNNVQQYPELARDISSAGHLVGNHTRTHPNLFLKREQFQMAEIEWTRNLIEEVIQRPTRAFRPPYGYFNHTTLNILHRLDLRLVMWDTDPRDYSARSSESLIRFVGRKTRGGSILLYHDNELTAGRTSEYLDPSIARLIDMGFHFDVVPL